MGVFKLAFFVAHGTKLANERAIRLENLYSVIFLVTDIDESQGVGCDAPWIIEATICCALTSKCS